MSNLYTALLSVTLGVYPKTYTVQIEQAPEHLLERNKCPLRVVVVNTLCTERTDEEVYHVRTIGAAHLLFDAIVEQVENKLRD